MTPSLSHLDTDIPRAFATRFEAACDRLCGLFNTQEVEDVFICGLSDLIKPNKRVLDSQVPDCALADTVAATQGFWDEALRLQ